MTRLSLKDARYSDLLPGDVIINGYNRNVCLVIGMTLLHEVQFMIFYGDKTVQHINWSNSNHTVFNHSQIILRKGKSVFK